jgi:hypothetical protein
MTYLVQCRYRDGLYWAERDAGDTDRATTVAHIRNGNLPNVVTVLECNPVEKICRDVTDDLIAEASQDREPANLETSLERLRGMLIDRERDLRRDGVFG